MLLLTATHAAPTSDPQTFSAQNLGATVPATVRIAGTWGGATAVLQARPPELSAEGDWIAITDTQSTADASGVIDLCAGWSVRLKLTGTTATTSLNARIY